MATGALGEKIKRLTRLSAGRRRVVGKIGGIRVYFFSTVSVFSVVFYLPLSAVVCYVISEFFFSGG